MKRYILYTLYIILIENAVAEGKKKKPQVIKKWYGKVDQLDQDTLEVGQVGQVGHVKYDYQQLPRQE